MKKILLTIAFLIFIVIFEVNFVIASCPNGMVNYWTFDNDDVSGTTVIDSIGGDNATNYGATTGQTGKVGQAFNFDGSNDYLEVSGYNKLDGAEEATIAFWLNIDPSVSGAMSYIGQYGSPDCIFIVDDSVGDKGVRVDWYSESNDYIQLDHNSALSTGTWHFIVEVFNKGVATLYIDGSFSQNATNTALSSLASNGADLRIGGNLIGRYTKGLIDEVAIFNRSLSASEIQEYYNKSLNGQGYCSAQSLPVYSSFSSPETTNFSALSNLSNVTMPVLATPYARIKWLGSGYNVSDKNFDQAVKLLHNFVSVDTSLLSGFNRSANITFKDVSYPNLGAYRIIKNGVTECTAPECVKLSASPVKFRVSHFSNYTTEGNSVPEFSHSKLLLVLFAGLIGVFLFFRKKS